MTGRGSTQARSGHLRSGDAGFVLVMVLLAVAALSALAVSLSRRSVADAAGLSVAASLVEARAAADAGLVRILAALSNRNDTMARELSPYGRTVPWSFGGVAVALEVRAESGKVDLLSGNAELLAEVIRLAIPDEALAETVRARINQLRRTAEPPDSLDVLLPPAARLTRPELRLGDHLTIFSGQSGVDPLAASPLVRKALLARRPDLAAALDESIAQGILTADLAAGLGNLIVQQRGLYTIEAEARLPNGVRARKGALVTTDFGDGMARVERRFDLMPGPSQPRPAAPCGKPHGAEADGVLSETRGAADICP